MYQKILDNAFKVFPSDAFGAPPMTLRGGDAMDRYSNPPPYDPGLDRVTDNYMESYYWGVIFLDPVSWRYYLPHLMTYAFRNAHNGGSMVIQSLLSSLRPPDREPPRFASPSQEQEEVIVAFLDVLAFDERSAWRDYAMQVLEEYWIPNALYRGQR
jgi:hypothetical protein